MKYMSWTFWRFDYAMKEIYDYGDRFYMLGMFDYITEFTFHNPNLGYFDKENVSGVTGKILLDVNENSHDPNVRDSIVVWNSYMEWVRKIRKKWPHIKWFLSIRNDGTYNAIKYLMDNVNGVQEVFLSEIHRILDENPWVSGIDLDLEHCGGYENSTPMANLIKRVSDLVHGRGLLLHYDLPAMNGENWSVGSENWCSYTKLAPYVDTVTIMSYDFAWQGSAPSAVSPKWWLDIVYAYASSAFRKEQVFMGLPGYGYCWQIDHYPDPNDTSWYGRFRGHTLKYNELVEWQNGLRSHHKDQKMIPFASYINDEEKCAYMYLHIYDICAYNDANVIEPAKQGQYKENRYVSTYKKTETFTFNDVICKRNAKEYNKATGNLILIEEVKEDGSSEYALTSAKPIIDGEEYERIWGIGYFDFKVPSEGTYDLVLDLSFTWFDRGKITVSVDGVNYTATMDKIFHPNAIRRRYIKVGRINLTAGVHTLKFLCEHSAINALFYGFVICRSVSSTVYGGGATFKVKPQKFLDSNGEFVQPNRYKLTLEVVRRDPDYCYIYSDDFRSYVLDFYVFTRYYNILAGRFSAIGDPNEECTLLQTINDSYTEFNMKYFKFKDIYIKSQFIYKGREIGIVVGDNKVGILDGKLVVYNENVKILTMESMRIKDSSEMNELAVRVRGTEAKIWINGFEIVTSRVTNCYKAGMYSNSASYECKLFEIRDSKNMYLQESITVTDPTGTRQVGRIKRDIDNFDSDWSFFYIGDREEIDTRTELISDNWDFFHSEPFTLNNGEEFEVKVEFDDIGFWFKNIFLVDANGASIAYYNDIFSYMYWFNEASNKYGFNGCAIWCTGEENPLVYQYLDKQV